MAFLLNRPHRDGSIAPRVNPARMNGSAIIKRGKKIGGGRLGRWGGCGELMNPAFKKKSGRYPVTLLEKGFLGLGIHLHFIQCW